MYDFPHLFLHTQTNPQEKTRQEREITVWRAREERKRAWNGALIEESGESFGEGMRLGFDTVTKAIPVAVIRRTLAGDLKNRFTNPFIISSSAKEEE